MSEKKELNIEELDKVTGGTNYNSLEELTFKFELGEHIECVIAIAFGKTFTKGCTIIKRGYKCTDGVYVPLYWLDVDHEYSTYSGWYTEWTMTEDTHFWKECFETITVVDQL